MAKVDLHVHTTASDGVLEPGEIVEVANKKGLAAVAITDHDTTDGVDEALEAAQGTGLEVIPGIELSAEHNGREVHILGYYLDHENEALQEKLDVLHRSRRERASKMVDRLAGLGVRVSWERVAAIAGHTSAFGRPHVAQALCEAGFVGSVDEAFDRYIGYRGPAYVARFKLTAEEALQIIADAQGVPVLAHPWRQEDVIPTLAAKGLVGLEVYYPRYSSEERQMLARLARQHGLVPTGGTDFHGYGEEAMEVLGEVPVPQDSVERLRVLANRPGADDHY
ncbi:MAG TPA: PHP domain-containing protein [Chloroflexi bacterium]|nr:PHP domain-containing protein [Chloroflexota bacterium]